MKTALLALALALPFTAHAITIDLTHPDQHLRVRLNENVYKGGAKPWSFSAGWSFALSDAYGGAWAGSPFDTYKQSPAGSHGEADYVYIDGPVVPAGAGKATLANLDELSYGIPLNDRWRLFGHISADELNDGGLVVTQTGELSYYDANTNAGWVLPFSDTKSFPPPLVGMGASVTIIDGPKVILPGAVPEPMTWAALLFGALVLGARKWRPIGCA